MNYYDDQTTNLLLIHCNTITDAPHIKLTKFILDKFYEEHKHLSKRVALILHVNSNSERNEWRFDFLCGWQLVHIDYLQSPYLFKIE